MIMRNELVWLVTGASQGFGRSLCEEVLGRGDSVVATVRDPSSITDLIRRHGDRLEVVEADLLDEVDRRSVTKVLAERDVDVLVNNAGRAICAAAEDLTMAELREQLELNFFAAAELSRAVLPGMRARGGGTIVQMSSQGGRLSFPGVGAYSAGKFALEGWSEALAAEVAPFGIRVVLVEPSRFRTGFNTTHSLGLPGGSGMYDGTVGAVQADLAGIDGRQEGDPARAAVIIADLVRADRVPLRLPLGGEAVTRLTAAYVEARDGVEEWSHVARSADFPAGEV